MVRRSGILDGKSVTTKTVPFKTKRLSKIVHPMGGYSTWDSFKDLKQEHTRDMRHHAGVWYVSV
jgi:hypothetical protein